MKKNKKNKQVDAPETIEAAIEIANEEVSIETATHALESVGESLEAAELIAATNDNETTDGGEVTELVITQELADNETVLSAVTDATLLSAPQNAEDARSEEGTVHGTAPTSDAADTAFSGALITNLDEIEQVLESVIFASTRPISLLRLKNLLTKYKYDVSNLGDVLTALEQKFETRGFQLSRVAGGYQFRTHPKNADVLQSLLEDKPARLSQSALEVLAIVAYKQPVTRSEIDAVRGIDSGHLMKGLLEKNLVRTVGHADTPGRPMIYGTTPYFLEVFSCGSLDDLPAVEEFQRELAPSDTDAANAEDADGTLNVLAATPDRGAFDHPAEERFETPDFGAPSENQDAAPTA